MIRLMFVFALTILSFGFSLDTWNAQRQILDDWEKKQKDFQVLIDDGQVSNDFEVDFRFQPHEVPDLINISGANQLPTLLQYENGELFSVAQGRYVFDEEILLPYTLNDPYGPDHNPQYNVYVGSFSSREEAENEASMLNVMGVKGASVKPYRSKYGVLLASYDSPPDNVPYMFPYYMKRQ